MKFLFSYRAQVAMRLVAWKGPDDPSTGDISSSIDPNSNLQLFIWNGTSPYLRNAIVTKHHVPEQCYLCLVPIGVQHRRRILLRGVDPVTKI